MNKTDILGAVARGWCNKANENKIMDPDLAEAIADEVLLELDKTVVPDEVLFERIWQATKHWDLDNGRNLVGTNIGGYAGMNGDDVRLIIKAISEPALVNP